MEASCGLLAAPSPVRTAQAMQYPGLPQRPCWPTQVSLRLREPHSGWCKWSTTQVLLVSRTRDKAVFFCAALQSLHGHQLDPSDQAQNCRGTAAGASALVSPDPPAAPAR